MALNPESYNERQQLFAAFKRALTAENATDRGVPAEIQDAWQNAVNTRSKTAKTALWLEGGGQFGTFLSCIQTSTILLHLCFSVHGE